MEIEVLLFRVDDLQFAVPSSLVREVVRAAKLSSAPGQSKLVEGLLNLRGQIVPALDVRSLFHLPSRPICHTDHFVIIEAMDGLFALRVDRATDLSHVVAGQMHPSPLIVDANELVESTGCLDDEVVHLLSVERLLRLKPRIQAAFMDDVSDAKEPS